MLHNGDTWAVYDIKMYSNLDCTGTNHNDGTPVSSGYSYYHRPEKAFDTDDKTSWGGIPDNNGEYWVGMEYDNAREVLCLSYLDLGLYFNGYSYGTEKFKIEGREMSLGMWTEIMMVEEHQPGERKNITLPVFSSAPSTSPSTSPSPSIKIASSAPSLSPSMRPSKRPANKIPAAAPNAPTSQKSSTPFLILFVSLGCAAFFVLCGVGFFLYKKRFRPDRYTSDGMSQSHFTKIESHITPTNVMDVSEPPNELMLMKSSNNNNTSTKHVLISARFDGGEKEQVARSLHQQLTKIGVNSFMVETTGVGDTFGKQTVDGLNRMYAMVAVCYEDYGEKTDSSYCSFYELEYALGHNIPVLPIKLCEEWPPAQCGEDD